MKLEAANNLEKYLVIYQKGKRKTA